jgi:hypothetical protein
MTEETDKKTERRKPSTWYLAGGGLAAAAVVVIAVLLIAGGGSDDESSDGSNGGNGDAGETFPPQVVRDSEIEAQEAGSPERALLEWWQAFQFADAAGVEARTSKTTLDTLGDRQLAQLVKTRGQGFQGVEVLGATENGSNASLRAALLTFQPEKKGAPPPTTPTRSRPTTFAMKKEGGEWVFADTAFLRPMVENLQKAGRQKKQGKQGQGKGQQTDTETAP